MLFGARGKKQEVKKQLQAARGKKLLQVARGKKQEVRKQQEEEKEEEEARRLQFGFGASFLPAARGKMACNLKLVSCKFRKRR